MAEELRFGLRGREVFGVRKDCGGLICSARREGEDLVLTYDEGVTRALPTEDPG